MFAPHVVLQVSMTDNGDLLVATQSPLGITFEPLPLVDGMKLHNPVIDGNLQPVPRPVWALDAYAMPAWEFACQRYDVIG